MKQLLSIFLHICCAPCLTYFYKYFNEREIDWKGYFFNPNIHPEEEYKKRLNCLEKFSAQRKINLLIRDYYGKEEFQKRIGDKVNRCLICYQWRLHETALQAKKEGYKYFSTTLLISPYQDHDSLKKIGETIGLEFNLIFYYEDLRPYFWDGRRLARENNLYLQKYCGCFLSRSEKRNNYAWF